MQETKTDLNSEILRHWLVLQNVHCKIVTKCARLQLQELIDVQT